MVTRYSFPLFLIALCMALITFGQTASAADKLVFNSPEKEPYIRADNSGFLDILIPEIFERIGLKAEVQVVEAAARALQLASSGFHDGAAERTAGLEKKFPTLVPVPETINVYDFVAFSSDNTIRVTNWTDLSLYSKAHIIGWKILEQKLKGQDQLFAVPKAENLFRMLAADRVQFVIYEKRQGIALAKTMNIPISISEPPLLSMDQYIFVHEKHKSLVPSLAAAIREMKRDGSFQRIVKQTLSNLDS